MFIRIKRVWEDTEGKDVNQKPRIATELWLLNLDTVESVREIDQEVQKRDKEDWYKTVIHFKTNTGEDSVFIHCANTRAEIDLKIVEVGSMK